MVRYRDSIIWPVNPNSSNVQTSEEETSVSLHIQHVESKGAVYWDVKMKRKRLEGLFWVYIYIAYPSSKIEYKCLIEKVINLEELRKIRKQK